jgi:hypothetical protein
MPFQSDTSGSNAGRGGNAPWLKGGFIEVKASKATTASRRLVPITENLRRWLAPRRQADGNVCEYLNWHANVGVGGGDGVRVPDGR